MRRVFTFIIFLAGLNLYSQVGPDTWLVEFTDKNSSPYSISEPGEFLTQRALDRRARYNIAINEQDLPVNPNYLDVIKSLAPVHSVSRWFNSVTVIINNPDVKDDIAALPFVRSVKRKRVTGIKDIYPDIPASLSLKNKSLVPETPDTSFYNYGRSAHQIGMLKGHILHNQGFQGQEMHIAVLDGGFTKADTNPAFDSLWQNGQILGSWDFVTNSPLLFNKHSHGAQVLSIMAAYEDGKYVGTAPKAHYYLFRTENGNIEYLVEEENWIHAIETADSLGVDLINSSLSYTEFEDTATSHTYADMDGGTTRITRAADIAASKGMLVVTSAANKGDQEWRYIGAPADGDSVLTVGAVDSTGTYAEFSSTGPTADGRIKPNITAQGKGTWYVATNNQVYPGNGTSFSTPIICGLTACLWQSNRSLNSFELIELLQEKASLANNPDYYLGYGLPDYARSFFLVQGIDSGIVDRETFVRTYPNPFHNSLTVDYYSP